jgi:glutaminyl-peptide cyclotransferase
MMMRNKPMFNLSKQPLSLCKALLVSVGVTLTASIFVAGCKKEQPATPAQVPRLVFAAEDGIRALSNVTAFVKACTPRDAMTPGAERAAQWIKQRLIENGLENAVIDTFTDKTPLGKATFHNVEAVIPGQTPRTILLLSHFDTKSDIHPTFQGANDSGSSTGLLLELARIIAAAGTPRHTIQVAFLDGEECKVTYDAQDGLHGSRHLAKKMKREQRDVVAVILMDMVGERDLHIQLPHNGTGALRACALRAADATGDRDHISACDRFIIDDHQPFLEAGFPAVNLIDFDYGDIPGKNNYWHTLADTLDKLSAESLAITGRIVLEMINQL